VLREVERAVHRMKPLVPLLIDDVQLPGSWDYFLASEAPYAVVARGPEWQKHIPALVDAVRRRLSSGSEGQPAPAAETVAGKPPATAGPPRPRPATPDEEAFSSQ